MTSLAIAHRPPAGPSSSTGPGSAAPRRAAGLAQALGWSVALLLATVAAPAQAELVPFSGQGNLSVFDAAAGTGGWVGQIDGFTDPGSGAAWPAVVVVTFVLDPMTLQLSGQWELTRSQDLASVLGGSLSGSASAADVLTAGGQLSLDYQITSAAGTWMGLQGFGLSFLDFTPAASPDNYLESGLFVTAVPEPGAAWMLSLGAAALALRLRRTRGTRA